LSDPDYLATAEVDRLTTLLDIAGYNRRMLVGIVAVRLQEMAKAFKNGELKNLSKFIDQQDENSIKSLLCKVKGIGPTVAANACILLLSNS